MLGRGQAVVRVGVLAARGAEPESALAPSAALSSTGERPDRGRVVAVASCDVIAFDRSSMCLRRAPIVLGVAALHFLVWFSLFGSAFHAIDAGRSFPVVSGLVLNVLGAPLLLLLYVPPSSVSVGTRWWGDGASFLVCLGASNSLIWGALVSLWLGRRVRRRSATRSGAAAIDKRAS